MTSEDAKTKRLNNFNNPAFVAFPVPGARRTAVPPTTENTIREGDVGTLMEWSPEPERVSRAIFPIPGARAAGIAHISQEELERHQRSFNGTTPDDPYNSLRLTTFAVPGARPAKARRDARPHEDSFVRNHPPAATASGSPPASSSSSPRATGMLPPRVPSSSKPMSGSPDATMSFLAEMPTQADDPSRHAMWTELIKLKSKTLELQIAEARRKEKEAELELLKLKASAAGKGRIPGSDEYSVPGTSTGNNGEINRSMARVLGGGLGMGLGMGMGTGMGLDNLTGSAETSFSALGTTQHYVQPRPQQSNSQNAQINESQIQVSYPLPDNTLASYQPFQALSNSGNVQNFPQNLGGIITQSSPTSIYSVGNPHQTPMTPFDLEALLQNQNVGDDMFSWLPDFGESSNLGGSFSVNHASQNVGNVDPNLLVPASDPLNTNTLNPSNILKTCVMPTPTSAPLSGQGSLSNSDDGQESLEDLDAPTNKRRRLSTINNDSVNKKKKPTEKRIVMEHHSSCLTCQKPVARVLLRAPRSQIPLPVKLEYRCLSCSEVESSMTLSEATGSSAPALGTGMVIGSIEIRKRIRQGLEMEDEDLDLEKRRVFCDVCQRVAGAGVVVGGKGREVLSGMAEVICSKCDNTYQRCTDCGGGGGPRVGIGKWRLKQVFQPGRKTCSLSHNRIGDRPREIGVHCPQTDFTPDQLKEVMARCKALWNEKTLGRLAVPEMLEIDLPPNYSNPLRNYDDIADIITRNWPRREAIFRAEGVDQNKFKRLLGLTWTHSRTRRSVKTVDLEEEYAKSAEMDDDGDMSTVLANVKRTNVVIPSGSELIGMWGGEWDILNGSFLISSFYPFEGTDGEDSTALSVGELITKVQNLQKEMNAERLKAVKDDGAVELIPQCEHLWVVSGGTMPLIRERMADILVRKRSFVHVDEYLTRHPEFINALNARPDGLHPDMHLPLHHQIENVSTTYTPPKPLVLARWLGKDFDAQKILEIKQMEFGGKARLRKRPKSRF